VQLLDAAHRFDISSLETMLVGLLKAPVSDCIIVIYCSFLVIALQQSLPPLNRYCTVALNKSVPD